MTDLLNFATQNWVMTPVAPPAPPAPLPAGNTTNAIGQGQFGTTLDPTGGARPASAQRWLLHLSGVVFAEIKGNSSARWFNDVVAFRPSLTVPIRHVISEHKLKTPPGVLGNDFDVRFQVDQYALFAGPTSIFNRGSTAQAGFAVDNWRENPFLQGNDLLTNVRFSRLFDGMQVDVAVRDADAIIHRLSYQATLYGRIVFVQVPVIF